MPGEESEVRDGIIIDAEKETIQVGGVKVKLKSKKFWKYFGIGSAIVAIALGIYTQISI